MRQGFVVRHQRGRGVLHHHQAAVEAAARRQHGRQPVAQLRRQHAEDAALGDVGHFGQRDAQHVEPHGRPLAVEVAARNRPELTRFVLKDERIVRGRVDGRAEPLAHNATRSSTGPSTCGRAAQAVGVLHAARRRVDQPAAAHQFEQAGGDLRAGRAARWLPGGRIVRGGETEQRLEAQRRADLRVRQQVLGVMHGQCAGRGHEVDAV